MRLLQEEELVWSPVVANNRMNRKRKATGVNSYENDLRFNPESYLSNRLGQQQHVKWLDLCCGEGNALLQFAGVAAEKCFQDRVTLVGVDLVEQFQAIPSSVHCLRFETCSLVDHTDDEVYDLITCVHGLHYVGDKLSALSAALKQLDDNGLMIANLDIDSIKITGDRNGQYLKKYFRANDIVYDGRKKIIRCTGSRNLQPDLIYKGADDKAGPNYTGQEAVDSYYIM